MADSTRTMFAVYIVWHPKYSEGSKFAELIRGHFRSERYKNVLGDMELNIFFRNNPEPDAETPLGINLDEAESTAVVVFAESSLAGDSAWGEYVENLINDTRSKGLGSRVFPVTLKETGNIELDVQTLRWDLWEGSDTEREQRLIRELTYEFSRMLRHYVEHLRHPGEDDEALEGYLQKVQVFLSHSKHDNDGDGERIAQEIRGWLHQNSGLSSFFDVVDIPPGTPFQEVLELHVKQSAVVALHTDSYSSREWCRREVIEAKRWNVPMIVVNSMRDVDERSFPYMGNVPIVRMDPFKTDRIAVVIGRLIDEVFKDFLWRCRVELAAGANSNILFMSRPPELISLANLDLVSSPNAELVSVESMPDRPDVAEPTVIYPDPPLGIEEEELFGKIAPRVRLLNLSRWLTEV